MGAKTFNNNTPYPLNIVLTVREGDTPGNDAGSQNFMLAAGASQFYTYSPGPGNPYLDALVAVIASNGEIIAAQQAVTVRASPVDNDLNMNDTVMFNMVGNSLTVAYSNS